MRAFTESLSGAGKLLLVAALIVTFLVAGCASSGRERGEPAERPAASETEGSVSSGPSVSSESSGSSGEGASSTAAEPGTTETKAELAAPAEARAGEAAKDKETSTAWAEEASPAVSVAAGDTTTAPTSGTTSPSGLAARAPAAEPPAVVRPKAEASGLRAGYADDNKQFNYFVQFLDKYSSMAEHFDMDIRERIVLRVHDTEGKPVANADVRVSAGGSQLLEARSYADGAVLFFPGMYPAAESYRVQVAALGRTVESSIDRQGKREVEIVLPSQRRLPDRMPLDILFVLDTTGSMGEEIERLKLTIDLINLNLSAVSTNPIVRFGLVLYRDVEDAYVTEIVQPTDDLASFQKSLASVFADGGGDTPEDLQSALRDAMTRVAWNEDGLRLAFVITDAPPHLDYGQEYTYVEASKDAQAKGIKVFSVGTGGLDIAGEYVLRQVSQYTYARYIFLTYGEQGEAEGGTAASVSHHTGANFQTDKLESIIIRFAREELAFQSAKPLEEGDEYFEAVKTADEEREKTLATLFDMAIGQLADYSSARLATGTRAASVPLVGADATLGAQAEYLSEQLTLSLARSGLFRVVERQDLQKILGELELQLSGLMDDSQAAKVGNILGAEVLVTGRVYVKEDRYELFLKLLRVETGEILSVTKARVDRKLGI